MKKSILVFFVSFCFIAASAQIKTLWLDELDMKQIHTDWGTNKANKSIDGNTLSIAGVKFNRGIGTHAMSKFMLHLNKNAVKFSAKVGLDDESKGGNISFYLIADKKIIWQSGEVKSGDKAKSVDVSLKGVQKLGLLVTSNGSINFDHANWCDAQITYNGTKPEIIRNDIKIPATEKYILTPKPASTPRINGAKIVGTSPNKPFLFYIPVTGDRPMTYSAKNLPKELTLDETTGIITGKVEMEGTYTTTLIAKNAKGIAERDLKIVIGKGKLALTPPMGWNSWNCWGLSVSQEKVIESANAMVSTGLIQHGWTYMNIDDGWEAPKRAENGEILTNDKFPDMKTLCDDVHQKGLKIGIYTSPGEYTCGGYLGSYGHEEQDAETYSKWGIDYLKHDWCSYGEKVDTSNSELVEFKKPYIIMKHALEKQSRDIVYSLCQYGMGEVWKWGAEMGQLWRTTGDITDSWESLYNIGFSQTNNAAYAKPGSWNDPDMLIVGKVGWGPRLHDTRLTPDEQYTHISLWSLLSAPLLIGCDMSQLDEFTLNLLTNDEVIEINQDPLGKQATRILKDQKKEIWSKILEDGSIAIGIFHIETASVENAFNWDNKTSGKNDKITVTFDELKLDGKYEVRDVWRQKTLGEFSDKLEFDIPMHGVMLLKISNHTN